MREDELKQELSIEERLDFVEDSMRLKYWCYLCNGNHYFDSDIGKEHVSIHKSFEDTLNIYREYNDEEKMNRILELVHNKTFAELNRDKKYWEEKNKEAEESGKLMDSWSFHSLKIETEKAIDIKKSLKNAKDRVKLREANKFVEKYEPMQYGMDYPPIHEQVIKIMERQKEKIPDVSIEDVDWNFLWRKSLDEIMIDVESVLNEQLQYVKYKRDIIQRIEEGEIDESISNVPSHPEAKEAKKTILELENLIIKKIQNIGLDVSDSEKNELKKILQYYSKIE